MILRGAGWAMDGTAEVFPGCCVSLGSPESLAWATGRKEPLQLELPVCRPCPQLGSVSAPLPKPSVSLLPGDSARGHLLPRPASSPPCLTPADLCVSLRAACHPCTLGPHQPLPFTLALVFLGAQHLC